MKTNSGICRRRSSPAERGGRVLLPSGGKGRNCLRNTPGGRHEWRCRRFRSGQACLAGSSGCIWLKASIYYIVEHAVRVDSDRIADRQVC